MKNTAVLRTRIDPRRKARVERILDSLGLTANQAVNMLFAQIERRKAIPFRVALENDDVLPSDEHYGAVMRIIDT